MSPEQIGIFVVTVIGMTPLVTLLWKAFNALNRPERELNILRNSVEQNFALLREHTAHLDNVQQLAINGLKERIDHQTGRLSRDTASLQSRLEDIEGYLAKNTEFNPRKRG
jgi:hypothetical protein